MTAITHVYNYTVRCPHYQDPSHEVSWKNHIELNHSSEIALKRITKWHSESGDMAFEDRGFVVRKASDEKAYFAVQSSRLKNDGHALVTFKLFLDDCCDKADPADIIDHLIGDYEQRLSKL
ncbi:cytoplasmic protein [Shewanella sp. JM162201]|uniref:Cytoplasmic protein n=1 Tax=Shewanella jiangmenensis TaxID=2837387 RepID=A0ABS5V048_9GAMM|nr:cytoplasmic protein [Shewanella jiangmenensis]MBT1443273.1 cytoplasmic protein [Shewanella jiangmenensis]